MLLYTQKGTKSMFIVLLKYILLLIPLNFHFVVFSVAFVLQFENVTLHLFWQCLCPMSIYMPHGRNVEKDLSASSTTDQKINDHLCSQMPNLSH